ncbi:hypothetical protein CRI70_31385 [Streptomyces sp. Ru87]|nr:hypothetical protein CRI70_31385 [Streptomyces sp. Ru87]
MLGARGLKAEHELTSRTLFDLVKLSFGVVAGAGALVALVVAYRRQRVDEDGALRDATRLHTERFTTAVSQLGEASAAVRLGGVHALAGLADDAPTRDLRQTCIDVLCAYLRLPYASMADLPPDDAEALHTHQSLREVRHTIIRLIRDHLRLPTDHPHTWQGQDFDFTDVVFDGGDFSYAKFSGGTVNFQGAAFSIGMVNFQGVEFSGATVNFSFARFSGGRADFGRSEFSGGTVSFNGARFSGGMVRFDRAGLRSGTVNFRNSLFSGGRVHFGRAGFRGGTINFHGSLFRGASVNFHGSEFSGTTVNFARARFSGGRVDFGRAGFRGGTINFHGSLFRGGTVDFSRAGGATPGNLVPMDGRPLPTGLSLPPEWHAPTS